jgi:hypothetical protein
MVLQGAGDLLQKIKMIWIEVEAKELYKGQPVKSEVEEFMSTRGFKILKDTVGRTSGDQLYVNKHFYESSSKQPSFKDRLKRLIS